MKKTWSLMGLLLTILPKKRLTYWAGVFSRSRFSRWIIPVYIKIYDVNVEESEKKWNEYPTLVEFFSRRLRSGARQIPEGDAYLLSPVDGIVSEHGKIKGGRALQIKGQEYLVEDLLRVTAEEFVNGDFLTLYLSPKDYHRIHMPLAAAITKILRIPGTFYPVNSLGTRHIPGLYTKNERVIVFMDTEVGPAALVAVGSTVVGSVQLALHVPDWELRNERGTSYEAKMQYPILLSQGDELGWFEMGSTVIFLLSRDGVKFTVSDGEFVKALSLLGIKK